MNKELEALERIRNITERSQTSDQIINGLALIEKALKRLEKIETTTHSVLREDISKQLKALEIIKRNVNITQLIMAVELSEPSAVNLLKEVLL